MIQLPQELLSILTEQPLKPHLSPLCLHKRHPATICIMSGPQGFNLNHTQPTFLQRCSIPNQRLQAALPFRIGCPFLHPAPLCAAFMDNGQQSILPPPLQGAGDMQHIRALSCRGALNKPGIGQLIEEPLPCQCPIQELLLKKD